MFPVLSVIWWLPYFVPCAGCQAHLSCGQISHFSCLPSLHQDEALAQYNCQSGCLFVAFGKLCSRCGFCGCFHQAVWSLSEAQACRPAFLNQCQPSYLGGEAKYHIFKTVMLCLSTQLLSPEVISCGFTSLLKYSSVFFPLSFSYFQLSVSKLCVGKMERFCCST